MPITITITGEHALHAAAELRNLVEFMQRTQPVPIPGTEGSKAVTIAAAPAEEKKPEAPKKAKKEAEKATEAPAAVAAVVAAPAAEVIAPSGRVVTLEEALERVKEIAGDSKNADIMKKVHGVIVAQGADRVSLIPAEKLGAFMDDLDKAFPAETASAAAGLF